jgi:hypothetical protein
MISFRSTVIISGIRLAQSPQHQGKIITLGAFLFPEQALVASLAGGRISMSENPMDSDPNFQRVAGRVP